MLITAIIAYIIPVLFGLGLYLNLVKHRSVFEGLATAWALGWGTVYLVLLVTSNFLQLHFTGSMLVYFALVMLMLSFPLFWRQRDLLDRIIGHFKEKFDKNQAWVLFMIIPLFLLIIYKAMLALAGFDELVYHAYLPVLIYKTGTVPTEVNSLWSNLANAYPNFFVLQQSWIYLISGSVNDVYVRPLPAIYSILITGMIYSITARSYSTRAGIYAIIIFISAPLFVYMSVRFLAEMPLAFFAILGLNYFIRWEIESENSEHDGDMRTYLLLSGLFLGFATTVKYNGLILVIAAFVVMGYKARARFLWALSGFLIGFVPFYLRNYFLYGNPVFPFFNILFDGKKIQMLSLHNIQYSFGNQPGQALAIIMSLAFILALVYLYPTIKERRSLSLFLIPLLSFILVFIIQPAPQSFARYVFFIVPMISIPAGRSLEWLIHDNFARWLESIKTGFGIKMLLRVQVVILCLILIIPSYGHAIDIKYDIYRDGSFSAASDNGVLYNQGDYLKVGRWMDDNLPAGSKVLSFEVRRYYIETEIVPADSDLVFETYNSDLFSALQYIHSLGVTHVLDVPKYHTTVMTKPLYEKSPIFRNLTNESFVRIYSSGDTVLYKIDYDLAFGKIIDQKSNSDEKRKWLDIKHYITMENGSISLITNANTTVELAWNDTSVALSPQAGGAKRLWLDVIVAPPKYFSEVKSKYITNNLTFEEKSGENGKLFVYAVGSERYFNEGPLLKSKPWAISSKKIFDTSDYMEGGYHIIFLRKVLV